jgi:hypothetical protein
MIILTYFMNYLPLITAGLALLAFIGAGIALILALNLQKLRKTFFTGKDAVNLEDFVLNQNKKINELYKQAGYIEQEVHNLQEIQKISIQKIGVLRYNPFADDGGNLSFSIAIMDARDNGVVITSMHGREQNRVYAKPVKDGKSDFPLSNEEIQAIKISKTL